MTHIPAVAGVHIPNVLHDIGVQVHASWLAPAGRMIISGLILALATGALLMVCRRPKSPEPVTWAGAMLGATGAFGLMLIAYGVFPHEWITFANSYLRWDKTHFIIKGSNIVPFDIMAAVAADTGVVLIYGVGLGLNLLFFSLWQKREVRKPDEQSAPEAARTEAGTSAFGRPVTTS